ncbi:hypothetical protein E3H11_41530, partial [Bradyrhizobium brasilense]|nr:hypothetical protein [Bradyrhizobium brasilense]
LAVVAWRLEPFPFRWNRNGKGSRFLSDAFSSREPVSTSLENALLITARPTAPPPAGTTAASASRRA